MSSIIILLLPFILSCKYVIYSAYLYIWTTFRIIFFPKFQDNCQLVWVCFCYIMISSHLCLWFLDVFTLQSDNFKGMIDNDVICWSFVASRVRRREGSVYIFIKFPKKRKNAVCFISKFLCNFYFTWRLGFTCKFC